VSKGIGITMADEATVPTAGLAKTASAHVRHLACRAIHQLVAQQEVRSSALVSRLNALSDAFLSDSAEARHAMFARMRSDGMETPEMIDLIIPEVARILGQRWADDTLSFADVTIGSARLQETVRALVAREMTSTVGGRNSTYRLLNSTGTRRILMLIPRPEQHTLGAFVAADQFRRLGFEVDVVVDLHPRQVAFKLRKARYAMIGISVAGRRTLASARELVETARATVTRVTPIVLGGSLIGTDQDLKKTTGVDHIAKSVCEALELSGLHTVEIDPPLRTVVSLTA